MVLVQLLRALACRQRSNLGQELSIRAAAAVSWAAPAVFLEGGVDGAGVAGIEAGASGEGGEEEGEGGEEGGEEHLALRRGFYKRLSDSGSSWWRQ